MMRVAQERKGGVRGGDDSEQLDAELERRGVEVILGMTNHYGFDGRVALVTGGASGIGAATVDRLRAGGAEVHVFDLANGDDVRNSKQLDDAVARLPRLDVLVCSAGVGGDSSRTVDVTDEEWRRVHAINL